MRPIWRPVVALASGEDATSSNQDSSLSLSGSMPGWTANQSPTGRPDSLKTARASRSPSEVTVSRASPLCAHTVRPVRSASSRARYWSPSPAKGTASTIGASAGSAASSGSCRTRSTNCSAPIPRIPPWGAGTLTRPSRMEAPSRYGLGPLAHRGGVEERMSG
ncbi:hypothetical protein STAL104432_29570 [Streptomyces albus]